MNLVDCVSLMLLLHVVRVPLCKGGMCMKPSGSRSLSDLRACFPIKLNAILFVRMLFLVECGCNQSIHSPVGVVLHQSILPVLSLSILIYTHIYIYTRIYVHFHICTGDLESRSLVRFVRVLGVRLRISGLNSIPEALSTA